VILRRNSALGIDMRRFHSTSIDLVNNRAELEESETRHLRDVLRIREGDTVLVFDGAGHEYSGMVLSIDKKSTAITIDREVVPAAPESHLDLTLAVAITKGEKFDLVVQKAIELGVNRIIPIVTARCDVKPSDGTRRPDRWRKIALEASKQSGRARLAQIEAMLEFSSLLKMETSGARILFSERDGVTFEEIQANKRMLAVIGPEGGWEEMELESATAAGFTLVTFGGRILRAETAAIAIAAVLQHRFGDFG
jgi:16S rRNA (uracil1498-N3)-methyltransferase